MSPVSFDEAAERVKSGLDIVDIIQRHVVLRKNGRNFTGKCPFHNDNHPSMQVSREKGIFKCFACGVGGDALTFLMKLEGRTYGELIRELAEAQGIEIAHEGRSPEAESARRDTRQKTLELNRATAHWFSERLRDEGGRVAMDYLSARYPDKSRRTEALDRFQLGYAPDGWDHLTTFLKREFDFVQANPGLLEAAGLSATREFGHGQYDRFRRRLIIPIQDEKGQVVAFGGRALSDEEKPKYLNSPETAVYHKSNILYGLHQAREGIRQRKASILMEGYFDVITAHLEGITEAVGSCGTAMTDSHLRLLIRAGAETIYLAFDSDEAGVKAALNAITLIEPYLETTDLELKVLVVPDGKDPDAFLRTHGGAAFRALMDAAPYYLTFRFEMALRDIATHTPEGRIRAAGRVTPMLAAIRQPTVQQEYARMCAARIGLSEEALLLEVRRLRQSRQIATRGPVENFRNSDTKKAISRGGPTSYKRIEAPLTDMSVLRASLPTARPNPEQALLKLTEQALLKLALYNTESLDLMLRFFQSQPSLSFEVPEHLAIMECLSNCPDGNPEIAALVSPAFSPGDSLSPEKAHKIDLSTNGFLGTLMDKMNHLYIDKPDVLHAFAELVLTAEDFYRSLDLDTLKGAAFKEKLTLLAENHLTLLTQIRKRAQLRRIQADTVSRDSGEQVELTYRFHHHLASDAQPL